MYALFVWLNVWIIVSYGEGNDANIDDEGTEHKNAIIERYGEYINLVLVVWICIVMAVFIWDLTRRLSGIKFIYIFLYVVLVIFMLFCWLILCLLILYFILLMRMYFIDQAQN